ncbi:DASH complex subunit ask1-like [Teratosphaeria destructans]|uniref:DASH complex subunit ASK1 n=1 Tax=Teratosphaeria destructans TaxID=418781 RepID=A0A9W7SJF9_9PEZI|nr:DASH complex subunit ask1-like [Teratosphaeria destructans]
MSRAGPARQLTLTEELEKLEQSITLTLQEIDSNFSKAHRIVTGSILPIVEQYAKASGDVWEGSKVSQSLSQIGRSDADNGQFWKQFFEASANVSLSGYEEAALEDDTDATATQHEAEEDTSATLQTPVDYSAATAGAGQDEDESEEFSVDSPTQVTGVQATPKLNQPTATSTRNASGRHAAFRSPSPRKYTGRNPLAMTPGSDEPSTPRPRADMGLAPESSPFEPESAYQPSAFKASTLGRPGAKRHNSNDPLLHRGVLDKNYRVQATPHTQRRQRHQKAAATPATATKTTRQLWEDSPDSSPEVAAPQLRSDLFSPAKTAPRTPGISVMTPARGRHQPQHQQHTTSTGRKLFSPQDKAYASARSRPSHIFEDDSDEDDLDMSPPKTMQFHVPQSRLLQTPAREASKRIVEDLLLTAGADGTTDIEAQGEGLEEASPSVVRRALFDDDTF